MPQRELPRAKPHTSLAHDSLRDKLPAGTTIVDRGAEGVFLVVQAVNTGKTGPDRSESRIDSRQDRDMIARGEEPWYMKHLNAAKKAPSKPATESSK